MLTLDVSNAFNSAPWSKIVEALENMDTPMYLKSIIRNYLSNRKIRYEVNGTMNAFQVERGVLQGSVIGPCLWNVLHDDLLKTELPKEVELIELADDVAVVATAEHSNFLEEDYTKPTTRSTVG